MINEKSLGTLKLTEEQLKKYKELVQKESVLRGVLNECGVHHTAVEKIIAKSDLNIVDPDNLEALKENIKNTWSDFITKKGE